MDWFLYDRDLGHERVNKLKYVSLYHLPFDFKLNIHWASIYLHWIIIWPTMRWFCRIHRWGPEAVKGSFRHTRKCACLGVRNISFSKICVRTTWIIHNYIHIKTSSEMFDNVLNTLRGTLKPIVPMYYVVRFKFLLFSSNEEDGDNENDEWLTLIMLLT